jgi:urease accessory protein
MRATKVAAAGAWPRELEQDWVSLDFDRRHRRRIALATEGGATVLLDLRQAARLRDGDGLMLDSGGIIRVAAKPEALLEVMAPPDLLARLAWHLGNRHLPVQFIPGGLRLRVDHVIEEMLEGLGAAPRQILAAFDPEPGAYAGGHRHAGPDDD